MTDRGRICVPWSNREVEADEKLISSSEFVTRSSMRHTAMLLTDSHSLSSTPFVTAFTVLTLRSRIWRAA